jgi:hypothetical protein
VPRSAVPTVGELEARIDEAVVIARASEEGVREVGEMAIDAARQARRAAEAAEESARAAAAVKASASRVVGPAGPVAAGDPPPPATAQEGVPPTAPPPGRGGEGQAPVVTPQKLAAEVEDEEESSLAEDGEGRAEAVPVEPRFEERFRTFSERAELLSGRLRRLCEQPSRQPAPSAGAGRRRGGG